jgi:metal-sulfur cluster biosynthetic enzyme
VSPPSIQERLDEAEINAVVELSPGDYGPIELRRPVVLNAHGATFWSVGEYPAVRITTEGVCLQNATLRAAPHAAPSVVFEIAPLAHPTLQGVRVHGGISGLDPDEDRWVLPQRLDAGELRAPISHFTVELGASGSARLLSRISGIEFDPAQLNAGFTEVKMRIRDVSQDSILVGDVELIGAHVTRVIPFSAHVSQFEPGLGSAPVKALFRVPDARRTSRSAEFRSQPASPQPEPVQLPIVPPPSPLVPEPTAVVAISPPAPTASPVASPSSKAQIPQQPVIVAVPDPTTKTSLSAGPMHSLVPPPVLQRASDGKPLSDLFKQPNPPAQAVPDNSRPAIDIRPPAVNPLFGKPTTVPSDRILPPASVSQPQPTHNSLSPLFGQSSPSAVPDKIDEKAILDKLRTCFDPDIPVNIVDLGLVYDCAITPGDDKGAKVKVKMTLTTRNSIAGSKIAADAQLKLLNLPGVASAAVVLVWDPPWNQAMISELGKRQLGLI